MTAPYFGKSRREDLASGGLSTAALVAQPGTMHRLDLSAATGDVVVSFPDVSYRTNIESAEFGVIVTNPNVVGGHRVAFALNGNTFQGESDFTMTPFKLGDPDADRAEFLAFKKLGGTWFIFRDGRRRFSAADIEAIAEAVMNA